MEPICFISFILTPANGRVYVVETCKDVGYITYQDLAVKEIYRFFFSPIFERYWCWDWSEIRQDFIVGLSKAITFVLEKKIAGITAIGLCSEVAFLDKDHQLMGNPICSTDEVLRSVKISEASDLAIEKLFKSNGGAIDGDTIFHRLYTLQKHNPEFLKGIGCITTLDSLLLREFGAVPSIDISSASASQLLNLKTLEWDAELLASLGLSTQILPVILKKTTVSGHFVSAVDDFRCMAEVPLISGMNNYISATLLKDLASIDTGSFFVLLESDCYVGCVVEEPILNAKTLRSKVFPMVLPDGRWVMLKTSPGLRIIYECCKEWKKNELDVDAILFDLKVMPYQRVGKLLDINHIPYWKPVNITAEIFAKCVKEEIRIPSSPQKLIMLLLQSIAAKAAFALKQLAFTLHKGINDDVMVCGEGSSFPAFTERLSDMINQDLYLLELHSAIKNSVLAGVKALMEKSSQT